MSFHKHHGFRPASGRASKVAPPSLGKEMDGCDVTAGMAGVVEIKPGVTRIKPLSCKRRRVLLPAQHVSTLHQQFWASTVHSCGCSKYSGHSMSRRFHSCHCRGLCHPGLSCSCTETKALVSARGRNKTRKKFERTNSKNLLLTLTTDSPVQFGNDIELR